MTIMYNSYIRRHKNYIIPKRLEYTFAFDLTRYRRYLNPPPSPVVERTGCDLSIKTYIPIFILCIQYI